jgi:hypothetical protein
MRDDKLVELLTDAYAAAAIGRLITHDTVTRTAANVVFSALVEPLVPREAFAGYPAELVDAARNRLQRKVEADLAAGTGDMRELHRLGWTEPYGRLSRWAADLLSCPICSSFHALWLAHVATGRARPWRARWWLRLFAAWGGAQFVIRAQATPESADAAVAQAIMEVSGDS